MTETVKVVWWKVPIVGMPTFPGCSVPVTKDGRTVGADGEPLPIEDRPNRCGKDTTWMLGGEYLCAEHFPEVAEMAGHSAEAIEAAWRAEL